MTKDVPDEIPKLSVVMRQIGQLGGHLGRKSDGHPGVLTLTKGLYQLYSISIVWKLLPTMLLDNLPNFQESPAYRTF